MSIQRNGMFSLNAAAFDALQSPKAVVLLFDRRQKMIGFAPAEPDSADSFTVRSGKGQSGYLVSGSGFLKHNGVVFDGAIRFAAAIEDGVLVVRLTEGVPVPTSPRGPRLQRL